MKEPHERESVPAAVASNEHCSCEHRRMQLRRKDPTVPEGELSHQTSLNTGRNWVITDIQAQHYLFEIVREADLGGRLFRRFQKAAETWVQNDHAPDPDGRTLWTGTESEREMEEAIEGILSSFARISLFLFPERSTGQFGIDRANRLRELTSVSADHPIGNRDLRNHWMHLDHRFDAFVQSHGAAPVGYYLDSAHRLSDTAKAEMLRLVDPGAEKVFILGQGFELKVLADAVEHVGQQAALAIVDHNAQ